MKKKKTSLRTKLRNWSKEIRERDGNRCFLCGSTNRLQAHHMLPKKMWSEYKLDPRVGITLCCKCHSFGKYSVHRGAGSWLLMAKLMEERHEIYSWLMTLVKADKFLDELKEEDKLREKEDKRIEWCMEHEDEEDGI